MATAKPINDQDFVTAVESATFPIERFDHAAHLRLAYCYASSGDLASAIDQMRTTLQQYLSANGVDPAKYHETLTCAWMAVVGSKLDPRAPLENSLAFLDAHPELQSLECLLCYYSKLRLFSDQARARWLEPDLEPFPNRQRR